MSACRIHTVTKLSSHRHNNTVRRRLAVNQHLACDPTIQQPAMPSLDPRWPLSDTSSFYLCDTLRIAEQRVCLSVWLSVTAGIVSKRKQLASWFLHHLISHWYRSPMSYDTSKNSQGVTPSEGDLWEWGGFEWAIFAIFRPIRRHISKTVQGYHWTLIGNRMSAFDWYHDQRPWMTLNWPWTAITRFLRYTSVFRSPPQKYEWT